MIEERRTLDMAMGAFLEAFVDNAANKYDKKDVRRFIGSVTAVNGTHVLPQYETGIPAVNGLGEESEFVVKPRQIFEVNPLRFLSFLQDHDPEDIDAMTPSICLQTAKCCGAGYTQFCVWRIMNLGMEEPAILGMWVRASDDSEMRYDEDFRCHGFPAVWTGGFFRAAFSTGALSVWGTMMDDAE